MKRQQSVAADVRRRMRRRLKLVRLLTSAATAAVKYAG
jgi:hypothetical protein